MKLALLLALIAAGCGRPVDYSEPSDVRSRLVGAAREGRAAEIEPLVHAGADPNGTSGVNGWTVLMHAVHKNHPEAVRALLDSGADPNRHAPDQPTALMMAAGYGRNAIVRLLLQHGADPYQRYRGETALDWAVGGSTDVDDFTLFQCQTNTVGVILSRAPELVTPAFRARNRIKLAVCPDVRRLVSPRHAG